MKSEFIKQNQINKWFHLQTQNIKRYKSNSCLSRYLHRYFATFSALEKKYKANYYPPIWSSGTVFISNCLLSEHFSDFTVHNVVPVMLCRYSRPIALWCGPQNNDRHSAADQFQLSAVTQTCEIRDMALANSHNDYVIII